MNLEVRFPMANASVRALFMSCIAAAAPAIAGDGGDRFLRPDPERLPDVHLWTDVSNVWVVRDGDAALRDPVPRDAASGRGVPAGRCAHRALARLAPWVMVD